MGLGRRLVFAGGFVELREQQGSGGDEELAHLPLADAWTALAKNVVTDPSGCEPPPRESGLVRVALDENESELLPAIAGYRSLMFHDGYVEVEMSDEGEATLWRHRLGDAWSALYGCVTERHRRNWDSLREESPERPASLAEDG
jgi:hypothetical protein